MKINGEAIYNTRPVVPYKSGKVCFTTTNAGITYAITGKTSLQSCLVIQNRLEIHYIAKSP